MGRGWGEDGEKTDRIDGAPWVGFGLGYPAGYLV